MTKLDTNDPLMHHRLVEAFKYAYAYRSQIGDPSDKNITKLVDHVSNQFTLLVFSSNCPVSKNLSNEVGMKYRILLLILVKMELFKSHF